jgi:hypothetical protein
MVNISDSLLVSLNDGIHNIYLNRVSSIYSLKLKIIDLFLNNTKINDIQLYVNGKELDDTKSIYYYIKHTNKIIHVNTKLRGGDDPSKILFVGAIIAYIIAFIIYIVILATGFIPMFATFFSIAVGNVITYIGSLLGNITSNILLAELGNVFRQWIVTILSQFSILIFVYVFTNILTIPLMYLSSKNQCDYLSYSHVVGILTSIVFTVLYILWNIPNYALDIGQAIVDEAPVPIIPAIMAPSLEVSKQTVNELKFGWLSWIPPVPLYMLAVDAGVILIKENLEILETFDCKNADSMKSLLENIRIIDNLPTFKLFVETYKLYPALKLLKGVLCTGGDYSKMVKYVNDKNNCFGNNKTLSGKLRIFGNIMSMKGIFAAFCFLVSISKSLNLWLGKLGTIIQIQNSIKTGAVVGCITIFLYIIILIVVYVFKIKSLF